MSSSDLIASTQAILPLVILVIWACGMLLLDVFSLKKRSTITAALSALGLLVALGFVVARFGTTTSGFGGMVVADNFSNFLTITADMFYNNTFVWNFGPFYKVIENIFILFLFGPVTLV